MENGLVYPQMLEKIFSSYKGKYKKLLNNVPAYFNLLQDIYLSEEMSWELRFKINACFSYFAVPEDLIPDESPEGYLDDLFICLYVLKKIEKENKELIDKNWKSEEDIHKLINSSLDETEKILGNKCQEILGFTGLLKFNDMCDNMVFLNAPSNLNEKLERIRGDVLNLISVLRTLLIAQGKRPKSIFSPLRDLKECFDLYEWEKVVKILENSEIHDKKYDSSHELRLDEIRRKVLLEIDDDLLSDI